LSKRFCLSQCGSASFNETIKQKSNAIQLDNSKSKTDLLWRTKELTQILKIADNSIFNKKSKYYVGLNSKVPSFGS
jgi:hypothetical protein